MSQNGEKKQTALPNGKQESSFQYTLHSVSNLFPSLYSVQDNPPGKELSPSDCEQVIIQLLIDGYIQVNLKHTKYE